MLQTVNIHPQDPAETPGIAGNSAKPRPNKAGQKPKQSPDRAPCVKIAQSYTIFPTHASNSPAPPHFFHPTPQKYMNLQGRGGEKVVNLRAEGGAGLDAMPPVASCDGNLSRL